jgi:phosphoglycerate dehydrogenase-like enzyme
VALKVLAHFVPGDKVLDFLAGESDWLDIRWCADDDSPESRADFYRELPSAEVIWHVLRPLSGDDLQRGARLRLVHKLGAGVNTIDVATATKCGIAVANMPGANAPSVAEGTVLLMLAALRRLPALDHAVRTGRGWPADPQLGETVRDIGGCTVGLVGYGNIAKRVGGIVSLHLPLTTDTHHLIGPDALARMKPNAVLVNTSRGAVIDEDALVDALLGGRLAAAGLDVFDVEPVAPDSPLLGLDNLVLTPHVTWYTADTMRRYLTEAVANCRRLRDGLGVPPACGGPLAHVVNQPPGC